MLRKVLLMLCSSALVTAGIIGPDYVPGTSVSYSHLATPTAINTVSIPLIHHSYATPIGYTKIIQTPPEYNSVLTTKESKFESPDGTQHSTFSKSLDTAYSSVKKFETKSSKDGDIVANTIPGIYSTASHVPVVYHPHAAYTISSPIVHSVSTPLSTKSISLPVTYTTHDFPSTKTVLTPSITSYATPIFSNTKFITSGSSSYSPLIHTISSTDLNQYGPVTYATHDFPATKTVISPTITSYKTPVVSKTKVITSGLSSYSSHAPVIEARPIKTTLTYSEAPLVSHMSFNGLGASYSW